jgi:hypothetical protein
MQRAIRIVKFVMYMPVKINHFAFFIVISQLGIAFRETNM